MTLVLHDKIFGCVSNGRCALLDLETSTYLCVPDRLELPVQKLLSGASVDANDEANLQELVIEGILVQTHGAQTNVRPNIELPQRHITLDNAPSDQLAVLSAFTYQIAAAAALTLYPLQRLVEKHKARIQRIPTRPVETNLATLRKFAKAFNTSERLLPSNNKCLRRSLAMATYLAHQGIAANLVIAVKMRPFAAHAWTQVGGVVVNDHIDNVRPFTPILMV